MLPGLSPDAKQIVTNVEILQLTEAPKKLLVIGAGAVGVEFASIFKAFGSDVTVWVATGVVVPELTAALMPGPYRIPSLRIEARCVYSHNVPAGAYRGYGVPQVTWASESQMDVIADRLGLDIRTVNYARERVRSGEEKCRQCEGCLHKVVTLEGNARKEPR